MKNMLDALSWIETVKEYRKNAPEGFFASSSDRVPTLREVDPTEITKLATHFEQESPAYAYSIMKWKCLLEGREDGEFYSLTITRGLGHKQSGDAYRFFYRKTSDRVRREAYDYAL